MTKYAGPVKSGMVFEKLDGSVKGIVATNRDERGWWRAKGYTHVSFDLEGLTGNFFRPIRPAPDDKTAWERFLPDWPLPDGPVANLKVGQIWALATGPVRMVFEILSLRTSIGATACASTGPANRKVLAGREIDGYADGLDAAGSMRNAVLLFDADEPAKSAPAERQLAPGWVRLSDGVPGWAHADWKCSVGEFDEGGCVHPASAGVPAVYAKAARAAGSCEACAEKAGVFADSVTMPTLTPGLSVTLTPTPTKPRKPCPGCQDQGFATRKCWTCGRAPTEESASVTVRAVGLYCDTSELRDFSKTEWGKCQAPTGWSGTWIARERLPAPKREKVRDIYISHVWRDPEDVPNSEVR